MPFQSEKQRRYLWANEPKIARDWADTYGSRIEKNDGGISQLVKPGPGRPGYRGSPHDDSATGSGTSSGGSYGGSKNFSGGNQGSDHGHSRFESGSGYYGGKKTTTSSKDNDIKAKEKAKLIEKKKAKAKAKENFRTKLEKRAYKNLILRKIKGSPLTPPALAMLDALKGPLNDKDFETKYGVSYEDFKTMNPMQMEAILGSVKGKVSQAERDDIRRLSGGIEEGGDFSTIFFGPKGKPVIPQDGEGLPRYQRYPNYEELLGAQNQGVGGIEVGPEYDFNRDFQASLTGTADTPDYYAGDNPLASNLAWGKQMNVDPRTMGRTSYAADGGRISAAFGGIMDRSTGRRAYGLGSIFKSIKKAASKVLKSPIGKAAVMYGLGTGLGSFMPAGTGTGLGRFAPSNLGALFPTDLKNKLFMKNVGTKKYPMYDGLDYGKLAIAGATTLPFFMPGPEEDDEGDKGSNYDLLKNKYASQLMNIKRGVNAGSLDPNEFSYLPSNYIYTGAEGGRAGYYAGGQSIPSPYTIEDARKSSMQDKMGGITDVMKRADLARQGDVGQMYMAQGGRIGYAAGGEGMREGIRNAGIDLSDFRDKIYSDEARALAGMSGQPGGLLQETTNTGDFVFKEDIKMPGQKHTRETLDAANKMLDIKQDRILQLEKLALERGISQSEFKKKLKYFLDRHGNDLGMSAMASHIGVFDDFEGDRDANTLDQRLEDPNYLKRSKFYSDLDEMPVDYAQGGRIRAQEGGLMDMGGMEKDYRNDGGFVPIGGEEKADDVPARLSRNEFVFTADAVRGAGGGDIDKGAEIMENMMTNLEQGGRMSKESQGLTGAQEMFDVSERIGEVI